MIYLLGRNKFSEDETDLDICKTNIINIEENEEEDFDNNNNDEDFEVQNYESNEDQKGDDRGEEQNDNDEGELGDKENDEQRYINIF